MDTRTILLDVGGTFIKCSDSRSIPIDSAGSREEIVSALREAVSGGYDRIRVAIPGPFDYENGIFLMKHKFAGVYGESFKEIAGLPQDADVRFIHDVNCMLLGEVSSGAAVGWGRVALVSLGTGLGFSMFEDGHILCNQYGSPAVSIYNRPYRDGVLEDYASKRGLLRLYGPTSLTVKELAQKARGASSEGAAEAFASMGTIIGEAIAPILIEHGIECLLFGGQISRSADLFVPAVKRALAGVASLQSVGQISDIDNATFKGLMAL